MLNGFDFLGREICKMILTHPGTRHSCSWRMRKFTFCKLTEIQSDPELFSLGPLRKKTFLSFEAHAFPDVLCGSEFLLKNNDFNYARISSFFVTIW